MDELEQRVLRRLLSFCQKRQLIGPHRFENGEVHLFVRAQPHSFEQHQALRFLMGLIDQENLSDQFYETLHNGHAS